MSSHLTLEKIYGARRKRHECLEMTAENKSVTLFDMAEDIKLWLEVCSLIVLSLLIKVLDYVVIV
jgi:hypothetical protein